MTGLKRLLRVDDSLDVFGVHGVCGILGACDGVQLAQAGRPPGYVADWVTAAVIKPRILHRSPVLVQAKAVGVTVVWSALVAVVAYFIADKLLGLRVPEEGRRQGLDITSHESSTTSDLTSTCPQIFQGEAGRRGGGSCALFQGDLFPFFVMMSRGREGRTATSGPGQLAAGAAPSTAP